MSEEVICSSEVGQSNIVLLAKMRSVVTSEPLVQLTVQQDMFKYLVIDRENG